MAHFDFLVARSGALLPISDFVIQRPGFTRQFREGIGGDIGYFEHPNPGPTTCRFTLPKEAEAPEGGAYVILNSDGLAMRAENPRIQSGRVIGCDDVREQDLSGNEKLMAHIKQAVSAASK